MEEQILVIEWVNGVNIEGKRKLTKIFNNKDGTIIKKLVNWDRVERWKLVFDSQVIWNVKGIKWEGNWIRGYPQTTAIGDEDRDGVRIEIEGGGYSKI